MRRYFTSRMVSVCDIIWMLIWDWLVGRTSLERERGTMVFLLFGMDAEAAALDLRYISVLMNNRSISDELKLRTPYAVLSNLSGLQGILRQKPNNADSIIESLFNEGPKKISFHFDSFNLVQSKLCNHLTVAGRERGQMSMKENENRHPYAVHDFPALEQEAVHHADLFERVD